MQSHLTAVSYSPSEIKWSNNNINNKKRERNEKKTGICLKDGINWKSNYKASTESENDFA